MDNRNVCSIEYISKYLTDKYNAVEITVDEFINQNDCTCEDRSKNIVKVYKIEDENIIKSLLSKSEKEEILITIKHFEKSNFMEKNDFCSTYMNKISTGKLIVVILESEDKINLSGFTMEGSGEKLYNYLISTIGEDIEKSKNPLDETIYELNQFRPYGKYFK